MPAIAPTPPPPRPSKTHDLTLAVAAITWFLAARELAARSASGISQRVDLLALGFVLKPLFLIFLLLVGFSLLDLIARRRSSTAELLALPNRSSARLEWGLGAAIGWSIALLSVIPLALFGSLHVQLWTEPRTFLYSLFTLVGAALGTLALEITFRGYAFRRLVAVMGPGTATTLLSVVYGLLYVFAQGARMAGFVAMVLFALLLSLGWLRTHALWLSWGLHFAWTASLGILFGLPVAGSTDLSSIVQTTAVGRRSLTGGDFGPTATLFSILVLLLAIIPVIRVTRDFAWNYTHPPIVPGGYPMDIAPPAAHAAMETPAAPPPLVQILPSTPQQRSVSDPPL